MRVAIRSESDRKWKEPINDTCESETQSAVFFVFFLSPFRQVDRDNKELSYDAVAKFQLSLTDGKHRKMLILIDKHSSINT